jgi:hypothetical protein
LPVPEDERITKIIRQRGRKGRGSVFLSAVFKGLGILILFGSLIAIALSTAAFFDAQISGDLTDTVQTILSDAALGAALNGFVTGLILFGIGEIISLLNGIRRG